MPVISAVPTDVTVVLFTDVETMVVFVSFSSFSEVVATAGLIIFESPFTPLLPPFFFMSIAVPAIPPATTRQAAAAITLLIIIDLL